MFRTCKNTLSALLISSALLLTAGCGGAGGGGFFVPTGAVEVENVSAFDDVIYFEMFPAGSPAGTGDLIGLPLFPGEVEYVGDFYEDFYEADAELFFGGSRFYPATFVEGDFTTVFDVF